MKVLLDTTILIDMLSEEKGAIQKIDDLRKTATLHTSAVNIYEIWKGVKRIKRNQQKYEIGLKALIANIEVIPFNLDAAECAAQVYSELAKKGAVIDEADYMIAGCCVNYGIDSIITRNERHFKEIPELKVITY